MLGRTLYGKVAALLLGLFLFLGLFYLILTMVTTRAFIREVDQRLNVRLASYLVSKNSFIQEDKVNERALKESFESLMKINPDIELYLLDRKGRILSFAAPPGRVKREYVSLAPIDRFLSGTGTLPITGDDPRNPGERKVFSAATFPEGGPAKGYLYVILGSEEHDTLVDMLGSSYILRLSTGILIAGLLFSLAAGLFLFYLLTRRLRELTREVEEFKESNFLGALPKETSGAFGKSDEIDRLSHVFRDMSQRIGSQLREIHQADSLRREMLSNISHDLRTPLASLRGYIETVHLKGEEISGDERRGYLETALKHADRMDKRVSELFELAKLEAEETRPQPEPFHLGELVQDMVLKFDLTARKVGVMLNTDFPRDLPNVYADLFLIEKAIENLVANAIRYTGDDGGNVLITLSPEEGGVLVEVSDDGPGIKAEDLPYVFDRFYRASRDEGKDPERSGLGLAITRRIVELHGSTIAVKSEMGSGTTFTFMLSTSVST